MSKIINKLDYDFKEISTNNNIYILDPLDLELYHIDSEEDKKALYEKVILRKRQTLQSADVKKRSRKFTFNKFNKIINVVSLDISHGCTLKCAYCYLSAGYHVKESMSKEHFIEILKFLNSNKDHDITFYFAGEGEPTLNFNLLMQIPQLCRDYGFSKSHFEITTNGTLLTPKIIDFFEKENFAVSVSLDGDEYNNRHRVYLNGKPSYPTVIKKIMVLKKANITFACKATISPDNNNLLQMFQFFENNKIPFYNGFATKSFDGTYIPQISDVKKNLKQQLDLLTDYYIQRIKENKYVYARKIIEDIKRIHYRITTYTGCEAGINSFYFNMQGDIYICSSHNSSQELCVGNLVNGIDYEKIQRMNYYPKEVEKYDICQQCWVRYLCSGACVAAKWLESQDTTIPTIYQCALSNVYWETIIKIYINIHAYIKDNINFDK